MRQAFVPLALALALLQGGCALLNASRTAGKGGIQGMVEGIATLDPETRKKAIANLTTDVDLRKAAHDIAESAMKGVSDGISQADLEQRADHLVRVVMTALRQSGDENLRALVKSLGPQFEETLRQTLVGVITGVGPAIRQLASRDLDVAARTLVRSTVETFFVTAERSLAGAADKIAPAVGKIARTAAHDAVLGARDAIKREEVLQIMRESGQGFAKGLGEGLHGSFENSLNVAAVATAVGLTLLLVAALAGLVHLWRQYRNSTKTLTIVAQKINEMSGDNDSLKKLKREIEESAKRNQTQSWLSNFLKQRGL